MFKTIVVFTGTLVIYEQNFRNIKSAKEWSKAVMENGITKTFNYTEAVYFPPSRIYEIQFHKVTK